MDWVGWMDGWSCEPILSLRASTVLITIPRNCLRVMTTIYNEGLEMTYSCGLLGFFSLSFGFWSQRCMNLGIWITSFRHIGSIWICKLHTIEFIWRRGFRCWIFRLWTEHIVNNSGFNWEQKTKWQSEPLLGVADTFWLFIFSLNRAKKWFNSIFNSNLNQKYSFKKLFNSKNSKIIQKLFNSKNSKNYSFKLGK